MSKSPEWRAWKHMKQRCGDPKHPEFHRYGGRGITVCKKWLNFESFYADMGDRPSVDYSIDRINNNLGYCGFNCRWATAEQQGNNKRNSVLITHQGETLSISQWARKVGMPRTTLHYRLERGVTFDEAIK